jgi:hypothetical protein
MKPEAPIVARQAYTVDEFIAAHRISRAGLYQLWRNNRGPKFRLVGTKRLISVTAAREWLEGTDDQRPTAKRAEGQHAAA